MRRCNEHSELDVAIKTEASKSVKQIEVCGITIGWSSQVVGSQEVIEDQTLRLAIVQQWFEPSA